MAAARSKRAVSPAPASPRSPLQQQGTQQEKHAQGKGAAAARASARRRRRPAWWTADEEKDAATTATAAASAAKKRVRGAGGKAAAAAVGTPPAQRQQEQQQQEQEQEQEREEEREKGREQERDDERPSAALLLEETAGGAQQAPQASPQLPPSSPPPLGLWLQDAPGARARPTCELCSVEAVMFCSHADCGALLCSCCDADVHGGGSRREHRRWELESELLGPPSGGTPLCKGAVDARSLVIDRLTTSHGSAEPALVAGWRAGELLHSNCYDLSLGTLEEMASALAEAAVPTPQTPEQPEPLGFF